MATVTRSPEMTTSAGTGPELFRLTNAQYHKMIVAGVLADHDRVELLGGLLIAKMTKHTPHNFGVVTLAESLRHALAQGWHVREEKPIDLDSWSMPEPDIVVARGTSADYRKREPDSTDVPLIIEVADSSYGYDRSEKWLRYAAAKIQVYGILNIPARRFELYQRPLGNDLEAAYRDVANYDDTSEFPIIVEGRELGRIAVKDLLA